MSAPAMVDRQTVETAYAEARAEARAEAHRYCTPFPFRLVAVATWPEGVLPREWRMIWQGRDVGLVWHTCFSDCASENALPGAWSFEPNVASPRVGELWADTLAGLFQAFREEAAR